MAHKTKVNDIADSKERIEQEIKAIKQREIGNRIIKRLKFCTNVNDDTFMQSM